jgi:hypothetical protein
MGLYFAAMGLLVTEYNGSIGDYFLEIPHNVCPVGAKEGKFRGHAS